ncbi:GHKL domain-containing protein [Pontibacter diazotrophicus]|uniref:histidine kinase n=1 Tax=Pontibacter diazotrophicus TaxID=1400979 RepID=A0A3D8LGM2_9BACT|nr:HAMP domain-containing sensor histidine kinase [Pontibacter diazotrophicus]RDV16573.1 GHKL domain-containing protein [Pontibacter diazotrophicus]
MEFIQKLFQSDFMPHGHCYFWKPEILWLTVGGDALTAAAYYSIPLMLLYFARTRQDLAHKHVFFLFAAFILLCGTTHVLDIWTAWVPTYRLAGVVKMVTGLVSIATAVVLYRSIPAMLAIPSNVQLESANRQLKEEIKEREKTQAQLNLTKRELETRVQERTAQLFQANRDLEAEIEERKKAQKALLDKNHDLVRINADLDSFVYLASHDLKSPVANMEGLLVALREEMAAPDGAVEPVLERLETSVRKINRTILDLSDVSKIQRRAENEVQEEIQFDKLLADVLGSIQHMVQQSGVQIIADFSRQPSIWFFPQHLQSILQNLLTNAIKYRSSERAPVVKVSTEETAEYVVLTVEDNGIGIDLNRHRKKIFNLFKRLHDHVEGNGVGLYVIKRIIDNYQGKIEVQSEVNKGSTFRVFFLKTNGATLASNEITEQRTIASDAESTNDLQPAE